MRTHAQLCHLSTDRCVVLVEAFNGATPLGSALGEGTTATEAEDAALLRLRSRLNSSTNLKHDETKLSRDKESIALRPIDREEDSEMIPKNKGTSKPAAPIKRAALLADSESSERVSQVAQSVKPLGVEQQSPKDSLNHGSTLDKEADPQPPSEAPTDPEDWSEELTAIDLELQRIGWDRDNEKIYLERAFGHASRHRLTRFSDLMAYLKRLRDLSPGSDPQLAAIPLRRSDLIMQGDEILKRLKWSQQQAKDFLNQHLQASSRQQLTDEQLLNFNIMLEEQLLSL